MPRSGSQPGGLDSVPNGSPLISTERVVPSSRRAHHSRSGSGWSPLPSIVRSTRLRPLSIQKTCSSAMTGSQP